MNWSISKSLHRTQYLLQRIVEDLEKRITTRDSTTTVKKKFKITRQNSPCEFWIRDWSEILLLHCQKTHIATITVLQPAFYKAYVPSKLLNQKHCKNIIPPILQKLRKSDVCMYYLSRSFLVTKLSNCLSRIC